MLERLFDDVYMRQQLLAGPMGPYLNGLVSNLLDLGYCHSQARKVVRTAAALGDWLGERARLKRASLSCATSWRCKRRTPAGRLPDAAVGCTRGVILKWPRLVFSMRPACAKYVFAQCTRFPKSVCFPDGNSSLRSSGLRPS